MPQETLCLWLRFNVEDILRDFADPDAIQTEDKWYVWTNFTSSDASKKQDDNLESFCVFNRYLPNGLAGGENTVFIGSVNGGNESLDQIQNSGIIVSGLNPPEPPPEIANSNDQERIWFATVMTPRAPGDYQCEVMVHPGSTLFRDPAGGAVGKGVLVTQRRLIVE